MTDSGSNVSVEIYVSYGTHLLDHMDTPRSLVSEADKHLELVHSFTR